MFFRATLIAAASATATVGWALPTNSQPSGYCRRSSRTPCPPLAASSRTTGASSGPPATPNTRPSATTATTSRSPSNASAYNRARPYKTFNVDVAIDERTWPFLGNRYTVTLAEIRRRIITAGID
jgi:hypothetical protein